MSGPANLLAKTSSTSHEMVNGPGAHTMLELPRVWGAGSQPGRGVLPIPAVVLQCSRRKGARLMEINLRPARLDDAGALHKSCYPEADAEDVSFYLAWSLRQVQRGRMVRLVAEVDGRVVGNAQLTLWGTEGEIGSIVVAESHRRQGLARCLIAALMA
ncbi:MAG: GNAT family N-acetyltransferase, partial [Chloroflexi bacterium]